MSLIGQHNPTDVFQQNFELFEVIKNMDKILWRQTARLKTRLL